ncbi:MAG TPA: NUDIX hydrolase [Micromonosporaceae bacterium]
MTDIVLRANATAPWIPVPHRMEVVRSDTLPPAELTTAAFLLVLDRDEKLLLTHVNLPGRGWDVPGGHVDPGEPLAEAAVRETREETGYQAHPGQLSVLGFQRFTLFEHPPAWYHYPFPLSYTAWFRTRSEQAAPAVVPDPASECGPALWCTAQEVYQRCPRVSWRPFVEWLFAMPGETNRR